MLLCFSLPPLLSPCLVKEILYINLKIFSSVLFQTFSLFTLVRISWWVCDFSYVLVSKLAISLVGNHLCIHLSFISTLQNVSAFSIFILEKQDVRFTAKPCFTCYTHVSLAGFLRRILGLGEETSVGAPPTPPPWVCACTMVATGWVVLKVLLMGLATKPSAKTTPEFKKTKQNINYKQISVKDSETRLFGMI